MFPPLFFFSGLYYTDVVSTMFVLLAYTASRRDLPKYIQHLSVITTGAIALLFRQTNIFWVAVFPAGLAIIDFLKRKSAQGGQLQNHYRTSYEDIIWTSWHNGKLHDPPLSGADLHDFVKTALSVVLVTASDVSSAIGVLIPYAILLSLFAMFVAWNGGVVLGDKSNHVATLHLPQMLYIWPYMTFFSWPLVYPYIMTFLLPKRMLPQFFEPYMLGPVTLKHSKLISAIYILAILAVFLLIIHYNTIVHPFTLADNRHYIFYVFRILLQHPSIKYLTAPIYQICAWFVLHTLEVPSGVIHTSKLQSLGAIVSKENPSSASSLHSIGSERKLQECHISFVLAWLAATTLCLVTAPLVEPRYFIIPWIMWRLHVPSPAHAYAVETSRPQRGKSPRENNSQVLQVTQSNVRRLLGQKLAQLDHRLLLETAWFLMVNFITGYLFLYRGFEWPQEPGKVQRFMW